MAGWVYALRRGDEMKIGASERDDVMKRIRELQTGQPDELELVHKWRIDNGSPYPVEQAMHSLLHPHHFRGEWFSVDGKQALEAYAAVTGASDWFRFRRRLVASLWSAWAGLLVAARRGCTGIGMAVVAVLALRVASSLL